MRQEGSDPRERSPFARSPRLGRATWGLRWGRRIACWAAPPGEARRAVLATLERQLAGRFRVVRIPYGAVPVAEICAWALAGLGEDLSSDPETDLLAVCTRRAVRPQRVLLLVEEADRMPLAEAGRLRALVRRAGGRLRLVVVTEETREGQRVRETLLGRRRRPSPPPPQTLPAPSALPAQGEFAVPGPPAARVAGRGEPAHSRRRRRRVASQAPPAASRSCRYVPRASTEAALEGLEGRLRRGERVVVLSGPPGMGKSLLLRILGERLADRFEAIFVPCMVLGGEDLLRWLLHCRGLSSRDAEPEQAWLRQAAAAAALGRGLLLLLDDAHALSEEAAARLGGLLERAEGSLCIAATECDGPVPGSGVGFRGAAHVRLDAPLGYPEARALAEGWGLPTGDEGDLANLLRKTAGVPASLRRALEASPPPPWRGDSAQPPAQAPPPGLPEAPAASPAPAQLRPKGSRPPGVPGGAGLLAGVFAGLLLCLPAPLDRGAVPPDPGPAAPVPAAILSARSAVVWVDGQRVGRTPLRGLELSPGSHRLRARFSDGSVLEQQTR